jgi:pimeloyl-ACP methyl ester carboxylesterase
MAWLRPRRWAPVVRLLRPELSVLPMPVEGLVRRLVPGGDSGWSAAGVDEFLRSYSTPRGRVAFNAVARNIYLDEPHGKAGLWSRLGAIQHESLFIWGLRDRLVPIAFMRHVERAFPAARHLELDCGHVPQVERPIETHDAIRTFLAEA